MPFPYLFSEAGESEFIDKLMVVVHRDMKAALDEKYAADNLPAFAVMSRGDISEFSYPMLVLGIERMASQETENGEWLSQSLTAGAGIVVKDDKIDKVKRKCEKYVRAFKAVVRKGILEMLPAASSLVEYTLDIDHQYFRHGEAKDGTFTQAVEIEIKIKFGEK
jgi:hypothetical protein